MAKCHIAPVNKLSTSQMELNGAVLSTRGRKVIGREMRFNFEIVLHIVDSKTVLNMINKTSTRFKVYEEVRIGEIQAATNGDVSCCAWISGHNNTADWLTRGRAPDELNKESHWWNGPHVLYQPVENWGLKFALQKEERFSDINRIIWVVARLKNIARSKTFHAGNAVQITALHLKEAEDFIVKDVQKSIEGELKKSSNKGGRGGRYAKLRPVLDVNGMWVVGERLTRYNTMTPDSSPQKLLPNQNPATRLFMQRAHQGGQRTRHNLGPI